MIRKEFKSFEKAIYHAEEDFDLVERRLWSYIFHFHYRKLTLLLLISLISYLIFRNPDVQAFVSSLGSLEYLGVFLAGMLFTFSFITPIAVGFFVTLNPADPVLVAFIGGLGAVLGNLLIFYFLRFTFMDEFKRLEKTKVLTFIRKGLNQHLSHRLKLYLLYALVGIILASPLPDEAGILILAGLTRIKARVIGFLGFIFSAIGIFAMSSL